MKKHPSAFKLVGPLEEKLKTVVDKPLTLFKGMYNQHTCPLTHPHCRACEGAVSISS